MPVTPERIVQLGSGYWASAVLGAASRCRLFTHIEEGARSTEAIAERAGISMRGAQALLDGLSGLGIVRCVGEEYENAGGATALFVERNPPFADVLARGRRDETSSWAHLPEVLRTGVPAAPEMLDLPDNPLWHEVTPWIAPNSIPVAMAAAAELRIADAGPISILDVGGGSGMFSIVLLQQSSESTATQIDWPGVNRIASELAARHGVAERFAVVDGDFHTADFGESAHDVAIYSTIAHQEFPEGNILIFRKLRRALKPGGALVVSDYVLDGERRDTPCAGLFHVNMLPRTCGRAIWRESDYRLWLTDAGFADVTFTRTATPSTLILAR